MLTRSEILRYQRHFTLPNVGTDGQKKLKSASILCVGAGGIGSPVALYLAAAGIGRIGIIDHDTVELSNLQRQILFQTSDIGELKADCALNHLSNLNPEIEVIAYSKKLTLENACELIKSYDLVIDGSDNFTTRYLINDACVAVRQSFISASIFQSEGSLGLFNHKSQGCYRCLFPEEPPLSAIPTCNTAGVFGATVGVIGTMTANLVLNFITETGLESLSRFHTFNSHTFETQSFEFQKDPKCLCYTHKKIIAPAPMPEKLSIKSEITASNLQKIMRSGHPYRLIDIREQWERDAYHIPGDEHILMNDIIEHSFKENQKIILYCKMGVRSKIAMDMLAEIHPSTYFHSLIGGTVAWKDYD